MWREGKWEGTSLPWDLDWGGAGRGPENPPRVLLTALHDLPVDISWESFSVPNRCVPDLTPDWTFSPPVCIFYSRGPPVKIAVDWKIHRTVCSQLVALLLCIPTILAGGGGVGGGCSVPSCPDWK